MREYQAAVSALAEFLSVERKGTSSTECRITTQKIIYEKIECPM